MDTQALGEEGNPPPGYVEGEGWFRDLSPRRKVSQGRQSRGPHSGPECFRLLIPQGSGCLGSWAALTGRCSALPLWPRNCHPLNSHGAGTAEQTGQVCVSRDVRGRRCRQALMVPPPLRRLFPVPAAAILLLPFADRACLVWCSRSLPLPPAPPLVLLLVHLHVRHQDVLLGGFAGVGGGAAVAGALEGPALRAPPALVQVDGEGNQSAQR